MSRIWVSGGEGEKTGTVGGTSLRKGVEGETGLARHLFCAHPAPQGTGSLAFEKQTLLCRADIHLASLASGNTAPSQVSSPSRPCSVSTRTVKVT